MGPLNHTVSAFGFHFYEKRVMGGILSGRVASSNLVNKLLAAVLGIACGETRARAGRPVRLEAGLAVATLQSTRS